jgi:hypothetical protein
LAKHSSDCFETPKLRGELAELAFMYRASSEGIAVAKPYGDSHPYDFLVQHKSRLLRVQVKSTFKTPQKKGRFGFQVSVGRVKRNRRILYTRNDIDVLVAFIATLDIWYLIPVEKLGRRRFIFFYPEGSGMPFGGLYEEYREAWHTLKEDLKKEDDKEPNRNTDVDNESTTSEKDELVDQQVQELVTC